MTTLPRPETGTRISLEEYEDWIARGLLPDDWRGELVEVKLSRCCPQTRRMRT
jgi:hypothetical protein